MLCPSCKKPLLILEVEGVELDACLDREGLWFDAQELGQLFELAGVPDALCNLEKRLERLPDQRARRRCPRCRSVMEAVRAPESPAIILDRCKQGHGLWFDRGELESLLACVLGEEDTALERVRGFLGEFAAPIRDGEVREDRR